LRTRLLQLYWELDAFPEVPEMLGALRKAGKSTAILSNGSPDMLDAAVGSACIGGLLDAVISVESVGIFKPARVVYDLVGQRFGCAPEDVLFVSSNAGTPAPPPRMAFKQSGSTARATRWTACPPPLTGRWPISAVLWTCAADGTIHHIRRAVAVLHR
jgi:hypothetical protein